MKIKICPVCNNEFPCYAGEEGRTCWCEEFPKIEINDALDCLCPDCLTKKRSSRDVHEMKYGISLR